MSTESDAGANADSPLPVQAVILAAGKGTRMRSALPKVLHPLRGLTLIDHCLNTVADAGAASIVVVVGHAAEAVVARVGQRAACVVQQEQLGTGHAVLAAEGAARLAERHQVVVTYGDMPLLSAETLRAVIDARERSGAAAALLAVVVDNPRGFGRIVRDADGSVAAIVEEVDCTPEQLKSRELNVGVYCFDGEWFWDALDHLRPNARKGEYFLTDLVAVARRAGRAVVVVDTANHAETIGINTRVDLADAESALRARINRAHMLGGVTLVDPQTTYIDADTSIAPDTIVLPNTHILAGTRVGSGCAIGPNTVIERSVIGDRVRVTQSVVRDSQIDADSDVGPWSHVRGGTHVQSGVHVGNFAELKHSTLGQGTKQGHFSYLGDASIGAGVNIGAGTITCNYDGARKHPTEVGNGAFIGSDTLLVAPVRVGTGARTGAGAVVTRDVPDGATVVGVPARPLEARDK